MTRILICMYSRNINEFMPLCHDHEKMICVEFFYDTNLDEYVERIQALMCNDKNILLCDEWGGSPFLGALIAGGRTGSPVITDVDVALCKKIISLISEGNNPEALSEIIPSSQYIDLSKMNEGI